VSCTAHNPPSQLTTLLSTGKDATQDFEEIGHSNSARELLEKYLIGAYAVSGGSVQLRADSCISYMALSYFMQVNHLPSVRQIHAFRLDDIQPTAMLLVCWLLAPCCCEYHSITAQSIAKLPS
jgi:hypothetical protein